MQSRKKLFVFILLTGILAGCNPARKLTEGNYLLVKNVIRSDTTALEKEKLTSLVKQKPNRRILGLFRFHLGVYNIGNSGKPTRFKNWLKSIGEEPVILDSNLTSRSRNQLNLYLHKQGFFNSSVRDSVHVKKKKARVYYLLHYSQPYLVRNINYSTLDGNINGYLPFLQSSSLIHSGDRYNEDLIDKERERITLELKDRGFFYFSKNYITISVDSSLNSHQADLVFYINRINENVDPALIQNQVVQNHDVCYLRHIYIQTDFNPRDPEGSSVKDTSVYNGYYILSNGTKHVLHDEALTGAIFIHQGDRYNQSDLDYTYKRLQILNVFKFINIKFTEVASDSSSSGTLLDVFIKLTPSDNQDITLETEATNTGGNLGIAGNVGYRNKNLLRGAELFELKLKGAVEALPNFNDKVQKKKLLFFNTYEFGPEASFTLKKLLFLKFISRKPTRYFSPSTNLSMSFDYQDRPDYRRSLLNTSFGWAAQVSQNQRLGYYPFIVSSVYVKPSPEFSAKLDSLNDPRLSYSYQTHLIHSGRITWLFNNQLSEKMTHFFYIRANLESSGLLLRSLSPHVLNLKKDVNDSYRIFGINYSQYIKPDVDVTYHHVIDNYNTVVYRIAGGIGFPYGNSTALPFEKSFFAGGANSLRAWSARTLGPGSYRQTLNIEESGDIKIEANVELRTFLIRFMENIQLEGATFLDAGNIWTRREDDARPGAQFKGENLFKEMALGGGVGMRFNFSFFILRLDGAVKLRDPSLELSKRWTYPNQKFVIGDITLNLAIGYPF